MNPYPRASAVSLLLLAQGSLLWSAGKAPPPAETTPAGTIAYKLRWVLPCSFSYPDGDTFSVAPQECDFILANVKSCPDNFNKLPLFNAVKPEDRENKERSNQQGFLRYYDQEAGKAYAQYEAGLKDLLSRTDPKGPEVTSQADAYQRVTKLVAARKAVERECPKLAEPFGGQRQYVARCDVQMRSIDAAIDEEKPNLTKDQKKKVANLNKRLFLGHGSAAGLNRESRALSQGDDSARRGALGAVFENSRKSGGLSGGSGRGFSGSLSRLSGESVAGGVFRQAPAADGLKLEKAPPQLFSKDTAKCRYLGLPTTSDGRPDLHTGDAFQLYEPPALGGHSATIVVKEDKQGRLMYIRQDGAPSQRGVPIVYPTLQAAVGDNGQDGQMTATFIRGKKMQDGRSSGDAILENLRAGQNDTGGVIPDALRVYADHAPFGFGAGMARKQAAAWNWCSVQSAGALQAAQDPGVVGSMKKWGYELASFAPVTLSYATAAMN